MSARSPMPPHQARAPSGLGHLGMVAASTCLMLTLLRVFWQAEHTALMTAYAYLRVFEVWPLYSVAPWLPLPGFTTLRAWVDQITQADLSAVHWSYLIFNSMWFNAAFWCLMLCASLGMAAHLRKHHPQLRHRRQHTLDSLSEQQATLYPHLLCFPGLQLNSVPLHDPQLGCALAPAPFMLCAGLVASWEEADHDIDTPANQHAPRWHALLDKDRCARCWHDQLGPRWTGWSTLQVHEKLLAAILVPRVAATQSAWAESQYRQALADSAQATRSAWEAAASWSAIEWSAVDWSSTLEQAVRRLTVSCLEPYTDTPAVHQIVTRHAYTRTVLLGLLHQARTVGVLPAAELRWLKRIDRTLWYGISSAGRQKAFVEAVALVAHYTRESAAGCAVPEQDTDQVTAALGAALLGCSFSDAERQTPHRPDARNTLRAQPVSTIRNQPS